MGEAKIHCADGARRPRRKGTVELVPAVRAVHTLIFFFLTFCVGHILYCGVARKITRFLYVAILCMAVEGIILALNHWHCPLTLLTIAHGGGKGTVVDTLFPEWFVPYVTPLYAAICAIGLVLVAVNRYRARKKR